MLIWQAAQHNADVLREAVTEHGHAFSLDAAAQQLGIEVIYSRNLPSKTSGMIIKREGEDNARIYINAFDSPQRQRFTLAHEIGHFVERMIEAKDDDFSFRDNRNCDDYDLHEFYADQFAGALLMPEAEVRRVTPNLKDVLAVSVTFDVSIPAARKRLERLRKQS